MKNFLKWFGVAFFSLGIIVYTSCIFMEPDLWPIFAIMDSLFAFFIFLLLRKRKPKAKLNQQEKKKPSTMKSMKKSYTIVQAQERIRILQDCLGIIEKTKNLETFFSRYDYGMQIAMTLNQVSKAGIIRKSTDFPMVFFKEANGQRERVLMESFWDQKEKIEKLSTPTARTRHWNRYLELLEKYRDQYDVDLEDEFESVWHQVLNEMERMDS